MIVGLTLSSKHSEMDVFAPGCSHTTPQTLLEGRFTTNLATENPFCSPSHFKIAWASTQLLDITVLATSPHCTVLDNMDKDPTFPSNSPHNWDWLHEPRDQSCNTQLQTSFLKPKDSFIVRMMTTKKSELINLTIMCPIMNYTCFTYCVHPKKVQRSAGTYFP